MNIFTLHLSKIKVIFLLQVFTFLILNQSVIVAQIAASEEKTDEKVKSTMQGRDENPLPPGWDTYTVQGNPHGIIVMLSANPRINDIPIQPGDYIGAFYVDDYGELKCGGTDFWLGDDNIIFGAFGDDPDTPEKDGFGYNEVMHFKVYSYVTHKEYDVDLIAWDPSYASSDHWGPLGLSSIINLACFVDFDAYATATPNPVCLGNTVLLEAHIFVGTNGNYTYSWTSDPPGFTSSQQSVTVLPDNDITYFLEVSDGTFFSNHQVDIVVNQEAAVSAGEDVLICEDEAAHLTATATNYSSILWTTSGDGTFDDPEIPDPFYTPGPLDAENDSAILTVTAFPLDDCTYTPTDQVVVNVGRLPEVSLPETAGFCQTQEIWVTADAHDYTSLVWSTGGDGTFSDSTAETTQYFPGEFDLNLGEFTLTCCVDATNPCSGSDCAEMDCTISESATVNAPGSRTKCENLPVPLVSVAFNYSSVLWTTAGDGTFENPNALSTKYYAGEQDKINGGTVVTINAFGVDACEAFPATKDVQIILLPIPKVDAGDVEVVCSGYPMQLNATVEDQASFAWSTSGDGYFNNTTILNPIYYPGGNDIATGGFTLTLTAQPLSPCTEVVSDMLDVEIVDQPQVEILTPSGQNLCEGLALQLETDASDYMNLLWETTGDGYFDDPTILNPVYYHGPETDLSGSPIILKVTAFAAPNCNPDVYDQITVSFFHGPYADAGNDVTACGDAIFLSGDAGNYSSVDWQTGGDGYFADHQALNTQYFPGEDDMAAGAVELCLWANGIGNCPATEDCLNVSLTPIPIAEIGVDTASVCYEENYSFDQAVISYYSSVNWFTPDGGGTFSDPGSTNPVYTPDPVTDYSLGCITIGVTAQPLSPCTLSVDDLMTLCFQAPPQVEIGMDEATICFGENYQFSTTEAYDFSGILWSTTNGGGSFDNATILNPVYYPNPSIDYPEGCIEMTVTVDPVSPCTVSDEDTFTLCFQAPPSADAGEDATIFSDETFLTESTADQYSTLMWSTSGDGNFTDPALLNTVYSPGTGDIENGTVELTLTAFPMEECTVPAVDEMTLTIYGRQTILLPAGWSGFSSFIQPGDPAFEEVMAPIASQLVIAQNMASLYWPEYGINTIGDLDNYKGYQIKLNAPATLTITGSSVTDKTLTIPTGWSILPVLSECFVSRNVILSQLAGKLILLTEIGGNGILWPEQEIFTLTGLQPGKAYMIKLSEEAVLVFPDCQK